MWKRLLQACGRLLSDVSSAMILSQRLDQGRGIPCLGLKRSLPNVLDLGNSSALAGGQRRGEIYYLNEMPYCDTVSKPLFQTSVTSQALVAERRHDKKAETALPPTAHTFCVSFSSSMADDEMNEEACVEGNGYEERRNAGRSFGHAQMWDIWEALEKWIPDTSSVADVGAKGRARVRGHAAWWPIA